MLAHTCDPTVRIEESVVGYTRYRRQDGYRWEVYGVCDGRGGCVSGATNSKPDLDCPITPELKGCCSFEFKVLIPCLAGTF